MGLHCGSTIVQRQNKRTAAVQEGRGSTSVPHLCAAVQCLGVVAVHLQHLVALLDGLGCGLEQSKRKQQFGVW